MKITLLFLLLVIVGSLASNPLVHLDTFKERNGQGHSGLAMAVDPANTLVVVTLFQGYLSVRSGDVSHPNTTWSFGKFPALPGYLVPDDPTFTMTYGSNRFVVIWPALNSNEKKGYVFTSYSTDKGLTWSKPNPLLELQPYIVESGAYVDVPMITFGNDRFVAAVGAAMPDWKVTVFASPDAESWQKIAFPETSVRRPFLDYNEIDSLFYVVTHSTWYYSAYFYSFDARGGAVNQGPSVNLQSKIETAVGCGEYFFAASSADDGIFLYNAKQSKVTVVNPHFDDWVVNFDFLCVGNGTEATVHMTGALEQDIQESHSLEGKKWSPLYTEHFYDAYAFEYPVGVSGFSNGYFAIQDDGYDASDSYTMLFGTYLISICGLNLHRSSID